MTAKRKRSASLKLTTMLAGAAALPLAACGDQPAVQWDQNSVAQGEQVEALRYNTLDACKAANEVPDSECESSWAAAQKDDAEHSPRYAERSTCEDVYGPGNCVPRGSGGGSFFTPLLTGFVIGRMLDGGGYYRGTGLYRGNDGYYSTWGGRLDRDYGTGRTVITREGIDPPDVVRNAPPKIQTRTSVVSRGGFGGGRSYAHSGSFKGGFGG